MKLPNLKDKAKQTAINQALGSLRGIYENFDKIGETIAVSAPMFEKQGYEVITDTLNFKGKVWKAILLREKDKVV